MQDTHNCMNSYLATPLGFVPLHSYSYSYTQIKLTLSVVTVSMGLPIHDQPLFSLKPKNHSMEL